MLRRTRAALRTRTDGSTDYLENGPPSPLGRPRECREELGREVPIGRLLAVDHQSDRGDLGDSVMFVYDGGVLAPELLADRGSDPAVAAIVVVDLADLDALTIPRLVNRIRGALAARENGPVDEAVDGGSPANL
jgi:hypothetical protein